MSVKTMVSMPGRWLVYIVHEDTGERRRHRRIPDSQERTCSSFFGVRIDPCSTAEHAAAMARTVLVNRCELH